MDIRRRPPENISIGRIIDINRETQSFTTMSNRDTSTLIRFNVSKDTKIFDLFGCPISLDQLRPGMRVRVRHAAFMTMSLPPQTTPFVIQVIR